jgi:protein-S-isoprenylcysteine O-methyltransferase Ste14
MGTRPPLALYAFTAAVVAGVLLASEHWVAGGILVVVALVLIAARFVAEQRGEDETRYLQ